MDVGVDIIEIDRIERMLTQYAHSKWRIFTDEEIAYCEEKKYPAQHYAARFAAKESVIKTLGVAQGRFVGFRDVEILVDASGKPIVRLHRQAQALGKELGIKELRVSLSHCRAYAIATCLLIR